jgi:hypothetical protein
MATSAILRGIYFVMVETRIAPRYRVDKRAIAEYGGDKHPCTVRDISATGAAIEFPDPVGILPFEKGFNLIIKDDGLRLACRIVWKSGFRMGVTFG